MKKLLMIIAVFWFFAGSALASGYNYVSPEKVKTWIETQKLFTIVDIQVTDEFKAHHLPNSIATYAYPVKTDGEKAQIEDAIRTSMEKDTPIVVVCPRGGGGAKRCYDYMKSKNVPEDRLLILEKGMAGWPYKDLVETGQ
ncbi:rhodanese-like domain-containing protein [Desulfospira joergensenii]|uniref:rhodanese-like domain-containing protein n=1 Tax=Desulfospira joergensenii TaxID=53329 RepID=UPI0003B3E414|nr:rhodanese-like domain-containing protein [Desulfospira joergensenii]